MTTQELTRPTVLGMTDSPPRLNLLSRLGAGSGALGFALAIAAIVVGATTGTAAANPGATAEDVARAYATAAAQLVWVGAALQTLALLCLFGFATYLATALVDETRFDWLRALTAGAGPVFVGLALAGFCFW